MKLEIYIYVYTHTDMHKYIYSYMYVYINKSKGNHTTCKARNGQNKMIKKSQQTNKIQFHSKTGIRLIIGNPRLTFFFLSECRSPRISEIIINHFTNILNLGAINSITPQLTYLLHTTFTPHLAAMCSSLLC